jgi:iron complex transport system substrate-binding protein
MRPTVDSPSLSREVRGFSLSLGHSGLVVLLGLLLLVGACNPSAAPATVPPEATSSILPAVTGAPTNSPSTVTSYPLTIVDDEGTTVTITAEPQRIVSLTPATTEILFALGAADRVVAKVEDVANYPPDAADVPVVGSFDKVDVEKIVGLDADLVVAGGSGGTPPAAIERLRSLAIPVVVVYATDVDGVFKDIELTGQAAGLAGPAGDLAASMRAGFDQVAAATAGLEKPRVFYETGDTPSIYGVADKSFVASMIELAGAKPITTGSTTNWEMPIERLVDQDPEIIVMGDAAYGVTADAVAKRPGWSVLTAVKRNAIEPVDDIIVTRPGPRLLDGLRTLAGTIHPDLVLPTGSPAASQAS